MKFRTSKKSKKTAKRQKDEWQYDGGQNYRDNDDNNINDSKPKGPRQTQDRDERLRRSRVKLDDKKKKRIIEKKLATKVKFSDVLGNGDKNNKSLEDTTVKPRKEPPPPSSLSVLERLQRFIVQSTQSFEESQPNKLAFKSSKQNSKMIDNNEMVLEENNDETEVNVNVQLENKKINTKMFLNKQVDDYEPMEIEANDEEQELIPNDNTNLCSIHSWYFNTSEDIDSKYNNKMNLVDEIEDHSLYSSVAVDAKPKNSAATSISNLPDLNKLWKTHSLENFGNLASRVMPYLINFTDALLERKVGFVEKDLLFGTLVHICTHTVKARAKVLKHNQKLKARSKEALVSAAVVMSDSNIDGMKTRSNKKKNKEIITNFDHKYNVQLDDDKAFCDQGFCRPRVLILCPFRGVAKTLIENMIHIFGENTSVSNLDKLENEFNVPEDENDEFTEKKNQQDKTKPEDWKNLFLNQNIDDDFKIGIQVNPGHGKGSGAEKGVYLRLFSDFFISDIIIASPIGLRLTIENDKSLKIKNNESRLSYDFLSSIEMVYLYQADVMYMQNWDHVNFILKHTNQLPIHQESTVNTDYSRIRPYFLDGKSIYHRQLIIDSSLNEPDILAFHREYSQSKSGKIRTKVNYHDGSIINVYNPNVKQIFQLIPTIKSYVSLEDDRFQYFSEQILSHILRLKQSHTLIIAPSYFSYIKIRNYLMKQEANAVYVCEYSRDSEISRGRSKFYHGTADILLYSGRAHFYRRYSIRGAQHLVFYSLPEYAQFYPEFVNILTNQHDKMEEDTNNNELSCLVLCNKYEKMALERIVGTKRCEHILTSNKTTFMFC
eukprot:gene12188-16326_t